SGRPGKNRLLGWGGAWRHDLVCRLLLEKKKGEAQELQLDEPKVGSDLLGRAESALNDVGRGVRGLNDICGTEHEHCGQERSRAHEPPPTGWIGTARL